MIYILENNQAQELTEKIKDYITILNLDLRLMVNNLLLNPLNFQNKGFKREFVI